MAMYAGKVNDDGNWDDNTSLGALLEKKFSALSFRQPDPQTGEISDVDKEYNKKIAFQAQAEAIMEHIVHRMEIKGIEVDISDVSTNVSVATTCPAGAGTGTGTGSGTATGQQSNSGTGLVK